MTRDVLQTIGVRLALVAAALVTGVLTARGLGPAGRGEYFLVVALSVLVVQFANLGLPSSNSYTAARTPMLLGGLLVNGIWVSLFVGGGGAFAAAIVISALGVAPMSEDLLWFVVLLAPANLFYVLTTSLLVGVGRIRAYNVTELAANGTLVIGIGLAIVLGGGLRGVLSAVVVGWLLASAALGFALLRQSGAPLRFDFVLFLSGVRYAGKAYLVTLLALLVLRVNVFVLQILWGPTAVGFFSVASQFADVVAILPTSVALVLFPRLVRDASSSWEVTVRNCLRVGVSVGALCVALAAFAEPLIRFIFGDDFRPSAPILLAMIPGIVFLAMLSVLSQFLASRGLPRSLVLAWLLGFGVALSTGAILVRLYGGVGVALSLSVTYCFMFNAALWIARRHRRPVAA